MSDEPTNATDTGTPEEEQPSRRDWLLISTIGSGVIATILLVVPVLGYVLGALFQKRKSIDRPIELDAVDSFPQGKTRFVVFRNPLSRPWDGDTGNVAVYVKRASKEEKEEGGLSEEKEFTVFAVNCAHLGCPVSWFEQAGLFLCPCHGGAYYANGDKASGPPPRGLFKYVHEIRKGKLYIIAGHLPTLSNPATEGES